MKSSRDYVKLANYFLQSLCQLLTWACRASPMTMLSFKSIKIWFRWNYDCSWSLSIIKASCSSKLISCCSRWLKSRGRLDILLNHWLFGSLRVSWLGFILGWISYLFHFSIRNNSSTVSRICWRKNVRWCRSQVLNKFLLLIIKITFPYHYNWIYSCRSEKISTWWKINARWWSFMSIKCI